jgi:Lar family restriction alleviation protein
MRIMMDFAEPSGKGIVTELKPCPFCGSDKIDVTPDYLLFFVLGWVARCEDCEAEASMMGTPDLALQRWNRRSSEK